MTCKDISDLIGPYVDDQLPEATRRRLETHLFACRDCAWDAQTLRITRERLRGDTPDVVASDAFRARILTRLYQDNPHTAEPESPVSDPAQYQLPIKL